MCLAQVIVAHVIVALSLRSRECERLRYISRREAVLGPGYDCGGEVQRIRPRPNVFFKTANKLKMVPKKMTNP